ncbi:hypothetical protein BG011_005622 [Mortierella polycephala]|uniref:Ubiquitin-like domain-containing protein n=1 Tax=Mortierella polycephala TaxID=41804 RepID=A0A9P6U0N6_9FUNG|nr:hypothetical protein BG011_005622 [Mortierella polycephala]
MDSLTVIISSPTHSPHKFSLSVSQQCSILELKEIIGSRLDAKPAITDQRLIFGGRILEDKDTLDHIFEKVDCSDSSPTIHVVVSQKHQHQYQQPKQASAPTSPTPLRFRVNTEARSATPGTTTTTTTTTTTAAATTGHNHNTGHLFTPFTTIATASPATSTMSSNTTTTNIPAYPTSTPLLQTPSWQSQQQQYEQQLQQPMQYVLVNGMPYLTPAAYLPMLHLQQQMQYNMAYYPYYNTAMGMNADGSMSFQHIPAFATGVQFPAGAAAATGGAAGAEEDRNAQENAAREQRRAASLWLLMKLAFGVYLFSQNGSIERIVLLHIAALIIFLHQTGRLRIVRRIDQLPGDEANGAAAAPQPGNAATAPAPAPTHGSQTNDGMATDSFSENSTATHSGAASNNISGSSQASASSSSSPAGHLTSTTTTEARAGGSQQQAGQGQTTTEAAQPRMSTWRSIEHALLTFVTSLVPAPPPDIDPAVANAAAAGERGM